MFSNYEQEEIISISHENRITDQKKKKGVICQGLLHTVLAIGTTHLHAPDFIHFYYHHQSASLAYTRILRIDACGLEPLDIHRIIS